jgi:hypothetical protein
VNVVLVCCPEKRNPVRVWKRDEKNEKGNKK